MYRIAQRITVPELRTRTIGSLFRPELNRLVLVGRSPAAVKQSLKLVCSVTPPQKLLVANAYWCIAACFDFYRLHRYCMPTMAEEDKDYFLPLEDQRVFGAGIKRKRIAFVPSSSQEPTISAPPTLSRSIHDRYLAIVLKKPIKASTSIDESPSTSTEQNAERQQPLCPICQLPFSNQATTTTTSHESSIAHQVCLTHSHPPSHLDREHVGLKYLSSYGWDPDARLGLGAKGEGIRAPIKAKRKGDTSGLGVDLKDEDGAKVQNKKVKEVPIVRLNAKQVRQQEAEGKRREANLRDAFYGRDLEEYLGPGG